MSNPAGINKISTRITNNSVIAALGITNAARIRATSTTSTSTGRLNINTATIPAPTASSSNTTITSTPENINTNNNRTPLNASSSSGFLDAKNAHTTVDNITNIVDAEVKVLAADMSEDRLREILTYMMTELNEMRLFRNTYRNSYNNTNTSKAEVSSSSSMNDTIGMRI